MKEKTPEKRFPTFRSTYSNDLDLIEKILMCYSILKNKPIRNFEMTTLKYYIKYGFNDEAKQFIMEDEGKKEGDIRVANVHLREKGYLNHGINNQRKSELSPDMAKIRQNFIIDKEKLCILLFNME